LDDVTYAPFLVEWLFVSVPVVLAVAVGVLAAFAVHRHRRWVGPVTLALGNLAAQMVVLWFLIQPTNVGGETWCASAMSRARLRPLPGQALSAYDAICHAAGVRIVTAGLLAGLAVALVCGYLVMRRYWRRPHGTA
jgi:hypothetical protein